MASAYTRLLRARPLTSATTPDTSEAFDAGGYRVLCIQTRVLSAGSAGTLKLQHAAVNEDSAYKDLTTFTAVNLNATANDFQEVTSFLRFIRWVTGTAPTGNPSAVIDVVAKE